MKNYDGFEFKLTIKNSDYILRDHRVHNIRILPGVTFLDIIFRTLKSEGFELSQLELKNILFKRPVLTSEEYDQNVNIKLEKINEEWIITARSQRIKGDRILSDGWDENLQCQLLLDQPSLTPRIDIKELINTSISTIDMEDVYSNIRKLQIQHYEFMKTDGKIHRGRDYLLADLKLSSLASQYVDYFYFHPAYLDASTIVSLTRNLDDTKAEASKPFIPIFIDSFKATEPLRDECYVYVRLDDYETVSSNDVMYADLEIYNSQGKILASFRKLCAKQVREKELLKDLQSLATEDQSPKSQKKSPATLTNKVSSVLEGDLGKLIQEDLKEMISEFTGIDTRKINIEEGFYDIGLDSGHLLKFVQQIENKLEVQLYPTLLFEYTNIQQLTEYLRDQYSQQYRAVLSKNSQEIVDMPQKEVKKELKKKVAVEETAKSIYFQSKWVEAPMLDEGIPSQNEILLFDTEEGLHKYLKALGVNVVLIKPQEGFNMISRDCYTIDPTSIGDYRKLLNALSEKDISYNNIIHMWSRDDFKLQETAINHQIEKGVLSLLNLYQAIGERLEKKRTTIVYGYSTTENLNPQYGAVAGFARTAFVENPNFLCKTINFDGISPGEIGNRLMEELLSNDQEIQVMYKRRNRYVKRLVQFSKPYMKEEIWKKDGVYLITGGAGGLGLIFAEDMAKKENCKLVLVGRSQLTTDKEKKINELRELGSEVMYIRADISKENDVAQLVATVKRTYGQINGVIHTAGVIKDAFLLNKKMEEVKSVFAPKIFGTFYLDEALKNENLDFFIMFSSTSAVMGNAGQGDYSFANSFLDHFAAYREELRKDGWRKGKSISINWPFWRDGGMDIDPEAKSLLKKRLGMIPLNTATGTKALEDSIQLNSLQTVVFEGDEEKIKNALRGLIELPTLNSSIEKKEKKITKVAIPTEAKEEPIAIIGLGGRYPMADDLDTFWENLKAGKDCITEIPKSRWNYQDYYKEGKYVEGTSYAKWGGFINDVDKFDPLFFNISPREAEFMDPQERLFLQTVWHTVEDGGYTKRQLAKKKVGVFVGVMWGQYQLYQAEVGDRVISPTVTYASIANRVSYFFDFRGPSIALDTLCSSSLTTVHLACESIRRGESQLAIAGGVNVSIHPNKFVFLSQQHFASSDGRCRSFGEGGDGYVPGEGVGAILLKPLSQAKADGDRIYGVIRSTSINHGGYASGYSVPNPNAQAELIAEALEKSNVNPEVVSYIEAHGTGTSLGDPIEISGLTKAFRQFTKEKGFCSIGSVKSNIGHLESAAGIAGITKILLQMKHGQLVPSIHSNTLNGKIDFENSPFYVQRELKEWNPPVIIDNGTRQQYPRIAGISSFGAGGSNAHIIIEEYQDHEEAMTVGNRQQNIIVLSAKNHGRLIEYSKNLLNFLDRNLKNQNAGSRVSRRRGPELEEIQERLVEMVSTIINVEKKDISMDEDFMEMGFDPMAMATFTDKINAVYDLNLEAAFYTHYNTVDELASHIGNRVKPVDVYDGKTNGLNLAEIAYTLQVGREAMEERLAIVVSSPTELQEKLAAFIKGEKSVKNLYTGNVKSDRDQIELLLEGNAGRNFINTLIEEGRLEKLAKLWSSGVEMDWNLLYEDTLVLKKISLPGYPFEKETYWIPLKNTNKAEKSLPKMEDNVTKYYQTKWEKSKQQTTTQQEIKGGLLLFDWDQELAQQLLSRGVINKENLVIVKPGGTFKNEGENNFTINLKETEDYTRLFKELKENGFNDLWNILHLWNKNHRGDYVNQYIHNQDSLVKESKGILEYGVHSVHSILKAMAENGLKNLKRFVFMYENYQEAVDPHQEAVSGFSPSLSMILPGILLNTVEISGGVSVEMALEELNRLEKNWSSEIKYHNHVRYERIFKETALEVSDDSISLKNKGVYLITGGTGGLGMIFARHLAKNYQSQLVLVGRSPLDSSKEEKIGELKSMGAEVLYLTGDISSQEDMEGVVEATKKHFGRIDGVLHSAGTTDKNVITEKEKIQFTNTLKAKVQGTIALDWATRNEKLDFFVMFSSASALMGDFGQCDYAVSNRFMDSFVGLRETLRSQGGRWGKTIAIDWPLWRDGGMSLGEDQENLYLQTSGMTYLEVEDGTKVFEEILKTKLNQVLVLVGIPIRMNKFLKIDQEVVREVVQEKTQTKKIIKKQVKKEVQSLKDEEIEEGLKTDLREMAAAIIRVKPERLGLKDNFGDFGFDSVSLKEYASTISEDYSIEVTPTVFFANSNIQDLATHLMEEEKEKIQAYYRGQTQMVVEYEEVEEVDVVETTEEIQDVKESEELQNVQQPQTKVEMLEEEIPTTKKVGGEMNLSNPYREPVAIIGAAGIMPGSEDLAAFWKNLQDEKELIVEIPKNRWDWQQYYSADPTEKNKAYTKFGGFIKDEDKFDAKFFGILPKEAGLMDPQQRLFLQTIWKTIEDGGYRPSEFSGRRISVFVGTEFSEYSNLLNQLDNTYAQMATGNALAMISNRISYVLNLRGPSETIDTACSGSSVAIHRAVRSIQSGESEMALAGGVSLMLTPDVFIKGSKLGVLSPDGRCKTFDKSANGYVRGEGVGAILLKPLRKAIEDQDNIYAVIRGSAENHGGRGNSLTAPNSQAQAEVLETAYREAGIDPNTISYIEAHGTGTELGDPVEFEGLKKAFKNLAKSMGVQITNKNYCGLGSVKTNIGHLEPAAGIAGVLKMIQALRYRKLPASLNIKELNPYISLENTPFYIVDKTQEWKPMKDVNGEDIPLRTGVSSFGFGGVNVHIVLEEYIKPEGKRTVLNQPQLFVLSAKNKERLKAYAEDLVAHLQEEEEINLEDVAYTLHVGRDEMEERVAIVASNKVELIKSLQDFITGNVAEGIFSGNVKETQVQPQEDEETKDLSKKGEMWVTGATINWSSIFSGEKRWKISLPTYPFEKKRYWYDSFLKREEAKGVPTTTNNTANTTNTINTVANSITNTNNSTITLNPITSTPVTTRCGVEVRNQEENPMAQWDEIAKDYRGDEVTLEILEDGIAIVRLQDKQSRNLMTEKFYRGLVAKFVEIDKMDHIKAVVLTGYDNIFCMGGMQETLEDLASQQGKCSDATFVYSGLLKCKVPVISAIQGHAVGGGIILGLFADIVVMAEEGVYSANFTKYGFTPGVGSTYILKDKLGSSLAMEMMFTAKSFSGEELKKRGASLIFKKQREVLGEALAIARMMAEKPIQTLKVLKKELSGRILEQLPPIIESEVKMHKETFSNIDVNQLIKQNFGGGSKKQAVKSLSPIKLKEKIQLEKIQPQIKEDVVKINPKADLNKVKDQVKAVIYQVLHVEENDISDDQVFSDMGVDSISGVEIIRDINKEFSLQLDAIVVYDYSTINLLAEHVYNQTKENQPPQQLTSITNDTASREVIPTEVISAKTSIGAKGKLTLKPKTHSLTPKIEVPQMKNQLNVEKQSNAEDVKKKLLEILCNVLHMAEDELELGQTFRDMGVDSISGVEILRDVNKEFNLNLDAIVIYDYSTIDLLAEYIHQEMGPSVQQQKKVIEKEEFQRESQEQIKQKVVDIVCDVLHVEEEDLDKDQSFRDIGVDSISGVEILRDINKSFNLNLDAVVIYDYSTINLLGEFVYEEYCQLKESQYSLSPKKLIAATVEEHRVIQPTPKIDAKSGKIHLEKPISLNQLHPKEAPKQLVRLKGLDENSKISITSESKDTNETLELLKRLQSGNLDVDEVEKCLEEML